jgi:hypothetical protein
MREGHERYRPTFLACAAVNQVIGGDLVATRHEGANPTFSATGIFNKQTGVETIDGLPVLWSYAFRDGDRRGLILINLDVDTARPVRIAFDGTVARGGAQAWTMTAQEITANNEYESGEPRVAIRNQTLSNFQSGQAMRIPPHSMIALSWRVTP